MSQQSLQHFLKQLSSSETLQEELGLAPSSRQTQYLSPESLVATAKRHGFEFTLEELRSYGSRPPPELTDQELEGIAGGARAELDHVGAYNFTLEIEGIGTGSSIDSMGGFKVSFHWDR